MDETGFYNGDSLNMAYACVGSNKANEPASNDYKLNLLQCINLIDNVGHQIAENGTTQFRF